MNKNRIIESIVLTILVGFLLFTKKQCVLVEYDQGRFFINAATFEIGWIHSVEKEPWFEKYEVKSNKFILTETYFKTFGAGTPSEGTIIPTNDGFVHMEINREVPQIDMMVSNNVKMTLITGSKKYPLYEMVDDYTNVTLKVVRIPLWQIIGGEVK